MFFMGVCRVKLLKKFWWDFWVVLGWLFFCLFCILKGVVCIVFSSESLKLLLEVV